MSDRINLGEHAVLSMFCETGVLSEIAAGKNTTEKVIERWVTDAHLNYHTGARLDQHFESRWGMVNAVRKAIARMTLDICEEWAN